MRKPSRPGCRRIGAIIRALVLCVACTASMSSAGLCQAQTAPPPASRAVPVSDASVAREDSVPAHVLGDVIVTADRWQEGMPVREQLFSAGDLDLLPGRSARDILKAAPGVTVSTGRKDEAGITIRGFGSRRVAILVDGRPMNLPYYGTFDLAPVAVDQLDRISVVRGPTSVTYGPNVMGGVVNFVTARGRDRPGTRVRLRGGNNDTGEVLVEHGAVRGAWDLLVSARGAGSDGSVLPQGFRPTGYAGMEDGGLRDNSDYTEWDLFAKLGYTHNARMDLAFSGGYHTLEKGVPGAVDEERYWRFTDWRRYFADVTLRHELGAKTHLEAKGYGDVFINTLVDYEDAAYDPSAVYYNSTHDTWDLGSIVALEHGWSPGLHGTYGVTVREDQIKKRMNPSDPWLYHHHVIGSLYAQHALQLRSNLSASLGLSDNILVFNHLKDVDHIPGFSAGLSFRPDPRWRVFGSAGQSSRFPTLSQMWGSLSGNRDLQAEVARRYELGANLRAHARLRTEATWFLNDLDDLIDRDVRRAGRYYNISSARSWGAEVGCATRPYDWLEVEAFYTHTQSENHDTGDPLDLVPEDKVDVRVVASSGNHDTQWVLVLTHVGSRLTANR